MAAPSHHVPVVSVRTGVTNVLAARPTARQTGARVIETDEVSDFVDMGIEQRTSGQPLGAEVAVAVKQHVRAKGMVAVDADDRNHGVRSIGAGGFGHFKPAPEVAAMSGVLFGPVQTVVGARCDQPEFPVPCAVAVVDEPTFPVGPFIAAPLADWNGRPVPIVVGTGSRSRVHFLETDPDKDGQVGIGRTVSYKRVDVGVKDAHLILPTLDQCAKFEIDGAHFGTRSFWEFVLDRIS